MRAWINRRSRLNHDLIRNRFLPALAALENLARRRIDASPEAVLESVEQTWEQIIVETRTLMNTFTVEMSPEMLFDEPPLCFCSDGTHSWLRMFVRSRWLKTCSAERLLANLNDAVDQGTDSIHQLRGVLEQWQCSMANDNEIIPNQVAAIRSTVQNFLDCLVAFPNKLLI